MEPLWEYIDNAKQSVFRFEGLQDYSAEDDDDTPPPSDTEWWRKMKRYNESGIKTQRVRLVILPMTDYVQKELEYLKEAQRFSGEEIKVINQTNFSRIAPQESNDFYIIDDQHVFTMKYGPRGKYIRSNRTADKDKNFYLGLKDELLFESRNL